MIERVPTASELDEFCGVELLYALRLRDLSRDLANLGFEVHSDAFDWFDMVLHALSLVATDGSFSHGVVFDIASDWTDSPAALWNLLSKVATGTHDPAELIRIMGWTTDNTDPELLDGALSGRFKIGGGWPPDIGSDATAWRCGGAVPTPPTHESEPQQVATC